VIRGLSSRTIRLSTHDATPGASAGASPTKRSDDRAARSSRRCLIGSGPAPPGPWGHSEVAVAGAAGARPRCLRQRLRPIFLRRRGMAGKLSRFRAAELVAGHSLGPVAWSKFFRPERQSSSGTRSRAIGSKQEWRLSRRASVAPACCENIQAKLREPGQLRSKFHQRCEGWGSAKVHSCWPYSLPMSQISPAAAFWVAASEYRYPRSGKALRRSFLILSVLARRPDPIGAQARAVLQIPTRSLVYSVFLRP
jgi:hypothetical protein